MNSSITLECQAVHHWFGSKKVLCDVSFKVARGQFLSLVGPSGCGKSTLLRAIVGTHLPRRGQVLLFKPGAGQVGVPIQGPGRDRGIVYQHYSLYPFLTALQNVALGPMLDETSLAYRLFCYPRWRRLRKRHLQQAEAFLGKVKLADAMNLYPHEMSGGMQQRVAIAQAMIMKPEIILLDEPFGALDEATREELQQMLLELYDENRVAKEQGQHPPYTLVIVTHELNEALLVGERVLGLSQYWDWRGEGFESCPGATIIYDKMAPVFEPKSARDLTLFAEQREEIRRLVFEPDTNLDRTAAVVYWSQVAAASKAVVGQTPKLETRNSNQP